MNRLHGTSLALVAMIGMLATAAAQQNADQASDEDLKQNFAAEHEIGRHFQIDPNKLPEPKATPIATSRSAHSALFRAGTERAGRLHGDTVCDRARKSAPPARAAQW
jgi:hypothetical protein